MNPSLNESISTTARKIWKALRLARHKNFRIGLMHGMGAAIEHLPILRSLDVRTVVDVGANIGQFSLLAWTLYPQAKIYAFEPQPGPAAKFCRNIPSHAPVRFFPSAIGTCADTIKMYVSRRDDSSSLLPQTKAMMESFPATETVGTIDVTIGPLDSFISIADLVSPALLKIDVQGFELEVLRGSKSLLHLFEYIYVELSFVEFYEHQPLADDVIAYLKENGFQLRGVNNLARDHHGNSLQADFLFVRRGISAK